MLYARTMQIATYLLLVNHTCTKFQTSRPNLKGATEFLVCGVTGVPEPLDNVSKWPNCVNCFYSLLCDANPHTTVLSMVAGNSMDVKRLGIFV